MLNFFFIYSYSRVLDYAYCKCSIERQIGTGNLTTKNDPAPKSKFAYVHSYACDDIQLRHLLQAEILGYQLKKFNKSIDRILLLPTNISIPEKHKKILSHVYTHFVYRPFIKWPCKGPEIEEWEKQLYFRLNIFTLNYSKVLYINGFNYFLHDPSPIFEFYPPVAAPDYQTWVIAKYGPTQNMDFLLIKPSMDTFEDIVRFGGCNYTSIPVNASDLWTTGHGPYDNGLIVKYYKGDIATLQWWWNYEMPGHYIFKVHQIYRYFDPQVVSLRFSSGYLPWVDQMSNISLMWTQEADALYEECGEVVEHQKIGIISTKRRKSAAAIAEETVIDNNEEATRFYPEFNVITDKQFWVQCGIIVAVSLGFILYSLTYTEERLQFVM